MRERFGNWTVMKEGIRWDGQPPVELIIKRDELNRVGPQGRSDVYDWLVHLVGKMWLTRQDIMDLNDAYRYALDRLPQQSTKKISWEKTMALQNEELAWRERRPARDERGGFLLRDLHRRG